MCVVMFCSVLHLHIYTCLMYTGLIVSTPKIYGLLLMVNRLIIYVGLRV